MKVLEDVDDSILQMYS